MRPWRALFDEKVLSALSSSFSSSSFVFAIETPKSRTGTQAEDEDD